MVNAQGTVSVIIPVMRDANALSRLLARLAASNSEPLEVIVVDGDDDEHCATVCDRFGARRIVSAPGRGRQLNAGAAAAQGDALWFLHADADPPLDGVDLIVDALKTGATGGFFRFRFAAPTAWHKSTLQWLINWRTRFGVPYGDQGLFAVRRAFFAAGGFAEAPLFEEVPLVRALRKMGAFRETDACIDVSCRRWERDGWLRRSLTNRMLAAGYALGIAPEVLARRYNAVTTNEGENARC